MCSSICCFITRYFLTCTNRETETLSMLTSRESAEPAGQLNPRCLSQPCRQPPVGHPLHWTTLQIFLSVTVGHRFPPYLGWCITVLDLVLTPFCWVLEEQELQTLQPLTRQSSGQLGLSQVPCSTDSPSQGAPPCFEADFTVRLLCRVPRAGDVAGWQDSEHDPQAAQLSHRQG